MSLHWNDEKAKLLTLALKSALTLLEASDGESLAVKKQNKTAVCAFMTI